MWVLFIMLIYKTFAEQSKIPFQELSIRLPNKISDLIDYTIKESLQLDREKITPYSTVWYHRDVNAQSYVCFACSLMARPLEHITNTADISLSLQDFPESIHNKIDALEYVRSGSYQYVFEKLSSIDPCDDFLIDTVLPELYETHPSDRLCYFDTWETYDAFLEQIGKCADILRKHGF